MAVTEERKVLVVDDEPGVGAMIRDQLSHHEIEVTEVDTAEAALGIMESRPFPIVITDNLFPSGMSGLTLLKKLRDVAPMSDWIMITGHSSVDSAKEAMRLGAFDYLTKPFDLDELSSMVQRLLNFRRLLHENQQLRNTLSGEQTASRMIVGPSPAMQAMIEKVRSVAPLNTTVLVRGESGVGKELIADEIHALSPRSQGPFLKVNCAALPENLLEDELFGHEKGAFTGANQMRVGRFEEANAGTLFLDEIAEMSPLVQAKLLRVLQEHTFQRIGSNKTLETDVRIVCATNADLEQRVVDGTFREDLYYRINVVQIAVPPLRERVESIPPLAEALCERICYRLGMQQKRLSPASLRLLQSLPLPGNVRELQNLLERALIFINSIVIEPDDLSVIVDHGGPAAMPSPGQCTQCEINATMAEAPTSENAKNVSNSMDFIQNHSLLLGGSTLAEIEQEAIRRALHATSGNMLQTAKMLDISRSTLYSKVKRYGLGDEGKR